MPFRNLIYCFCFFISSAYADSDYLQALQQKAQQLNLAENPEWHALLHYKDDYLFTGVSSQVDGEQFFNAPDGKTNPSAELKATLQAFFEPPVVSTEEQHKQCLFGARYHWLKQQLNFDKQKLAEQNCRRLNDWIEAMDPAGLTLIFPSAYLNNPASMFGHTFLRIDAKTQDERTRLLAYTISYAAGTEESNGIIFAMKGIFGGYPGVFSVLPYYMKVKEYSELENRDVWEYELNFKPDEIRQLLRHVWELRYTYFDYYFFDENCAYHLLSLLDVARPGLNLTQQIKYWAIPTDMVRIAVDTPKLLNNVVYRPALNTQLQYRLASFDQSQEDTLQNFMQTDLQAEQKSINHLPAEKQLNLLNAAYDLIEYQRLSEGTTDDLTSRQLQILKTRSSMQKQAKDFIVPAPEIRPEQGHDTGRLSLAAGSDDKQAFAELHFRPAYHDLLDPVQGYTEGAELSFASFSARYYEETENFELQDLTFVGIKSIAPRSRFIKPISWKMNFGFNRKQTSKTEDMLIGRFQGGPGMSWSPLKNTAFYSLFEGIIEAGDEFNNKHAAGAGVDIGLLTHINKSWSSHLSTQHYRYFLGHEHKRFDLRWENRFSINEKNTLRINLSRHRMFDYYRTEASLSWQVYF